MITLTTDHEVTKKEDESNLTTQEFVFYEPTEKSVVIEHYDVYNNIFLD